MGQMFYSMSLAMGIMVTYGSYTKNETSLTKSVNQIEILIRSLLCWPDLWSFRQFMYSAVKQEQKQAEQD